MYDIIIIYLFSNVPLYFLRKTNCKKSGVWTVLMDKHSEAFCQLSVTPQTALADEPVTIRVSNLSPNQPVLLRAQTRDDANQFWEAQALFTANLKGEVDVSQQSPQSGSYQGVDAMGLFWSMSVPGDTQAKASFVKTTARPL